MAAPVPEIMDTSSNMHGLYLKRSEDSVNLTELKFKSFSNR
jgi:hypothetical protein